MFSSPGSCEYRSLGYVDIAPRTATLCIEAVASDISSIFAIKCCGPLEKWFLRLCDIVNADPAFFVHSMNAPKLYSDIFGLKGTLKMSSQPAFQSASFGRSFASTAPHETKVNTKNSFFKLIKIYSPKRSFLSLSISTRVIKLLAVPKTRDKTLGVLEGFCHDRT